METLDKKANRVFPLKHRLCPLMIQMRGHNICVLQIQQQLSLVSQILLNFR